MPVFSLIPNPYDAAALKLLVEEAGGKMTDLYGEDQRYDTPTRGFIASNGRIHGEVVEMLQVILP